MKLAASSLVVLLLASTTSFANADSTVKKASEQESTLVSTTSTQPALIKNIPAESLYQILAAEFALDRVEPEIALANYIAAAKQTQDKKVAKRATEIALTVGSLEIALQPATLWAKLAQNDLEAQITIAAIYLRLHKPKEAEPFLVQLSSISPELANQHFLLLYQQLPEESEKNELVKALTQISKENAKPLGAELSLAEIYLSQKKTEEAITFSQRAMKKQPNALESIRIHSLALASVNKLPEAIQLIDEKLKAYPSLELKEYYLDFLTSNQQIEPAKAVLKDIVKNNTLDAEQQLELAKFAMQAQWYPEAESLLNKLKSVDESKDVAHYFLARLAELNNNTKAATEWYKQVLTGPFHVLSQIRASTLLVEAKDYKGALEVIQHTQAQSDEDYKRILLSEIDILMESNQHEPALEKLNAVLHENPDDIDLRYTRSLVATSLKKNDLAESDLKWIIEHDESHVDALNALGYLLTNNTKRYKEAHEYLSTALKLSPNNPVVLDSMGWLEYKMGNLEKSLEILQKAAGIIPDPEIAAHLGEVLWHMKDYKKAKDVWNQGLALNPKNENILDAMKRLIDKLQPQVE